MKSKKTISIVVPIYNELAVLPIFFERLVSVIRSLNKYDFEVIIVNDGSSDGSYEYLLKKKTEYSNIVIVDLSRNFGKEAALTAGIDVSVGDALIPIDCDLQDPPELIRDLILQWESGFEVVEAKRSERNVDSFFKKYSANFFYFVMNYLNQGKITGNVGDFRIIDKKVVESIKLLDERNRYMKGILSWPGFKKTYINYTREKRASGKTKFNFIQLFNLSLDGMTSFSTFPLKLISFLGFFGVLVSMIFAIKILLQKIFLENFISGYAFLVITILFLGSIQLLSLGIIGEYIGKIYFEVKRRPIYIINKIHK